MAVKKTASSNKAKAADAPAPKKKSAAAKGAVRTETASKTTTAAAPKAGPKKAAPAAVKLTATQSELLTRIGGSGETGYRSEKKAETRTIEALRERKLIKRGAKHKESGNFHYQISNAGKKFLDTDKSASSGSSASAAPASGGNA